MYVRAQKESNTVTFPVCLNFFLLFFPSCTFSFLHYASTMRLISSQLWHYWEPSGTEQREPGKTHTQEKTKGGEKEPVWGTMRKSEEMEKAGQKMEIQSRQCERTRQRKSLEDGAAWLYKKRGFSSPFKRTCSLDLCWTPLINFFQVFQPFDFNH